MSTTQTIQCLECDAAIESAGQHVVGEVIPCNECGCELEVASLQPFTLELAPEIEEDWGE